MTRLSTINLLRSIFDKKIPCRMGDTEVPSQRINHIINLNCPKDELLNLLFIYDHHKDAADNGCSIDYLYNKTYDIWFKVKTRYVINIGDPSKSHWKIVGYEIK